MLIREIGTNCKLNTKSFTFDGASEKKKNERRTTAGCNPTDKNSTQQSPNHYAILSFAEMLTGYKSARPIRSSRTKAGLTATNSP